MSALRKLWPFQKPLGDSFRVVGVTRDRRSPRQLASYSAIEQERADLAVEQRWRDRVRLNEIERMERQLMERIDAELADPDPQFDDWRDAAADDAGVPRFGEIK